METTNEATKKGTTLKQGVVVSIAMKKTIVVAVDTLKEHPKYKKRYISTKRYKVHVPEEGANAYKVGDTVRFRECRPLSRDKQHIIVTQ